MRTTAKARSNHTVATGLATRPDGRTVTVTIPAREEPEPVRLLRLVDQVVDGANTGWQDVRFERADVDVRIVFSADDAAARRRSRLPIPTIVYRASIGRLECEAPTAAEALEALVAAIKKSVSR